MLVKIIFLIILKITLVACQSRIRLRPDADEDRTENFLSYYDGTQSNYNSKENKISSGLHSHWASQGQLKKRLFVFKFWNDTPIYLSDFGYFASSEFCRGLNITQRVILLPENLSELATEDFVDSDKVRVSQLVREGQRMGVSLLALGRISRLTFRQSAQDVGLLRHKESFASAELEIKIFDVPSGREVFGEKQSGELAERVYTVFSQESENSDEHRLKLAQAAIQEAIALFIPKIITTIEKLSWEGKIAKIRGPQVFINAGKNSGITVGDILKVLTTGEDIYDPATASFIGKSPGQVKGTLEVTDYLGPDGSVARIHTGANLQEGDTVELY